MVRIKRQIYIPIRDRLILNFLFFGVVIIFVVGVFSYYTAKEILLDRTFDQLTSVMVVKKKQVERFFADRIRDINIIVSSEDAFQMLDVMNSHTPSESGGVNEISGIFNTYLARYLNTQDYYNSFFLLNDVGKSIEVSINQNNRGNTILLNTYHKTMAGNLWKAVSENQRVFLQDLNKSSPDPGLYLCAPLKISGRMEGLIILEISLDAINAIMYENSPYEGLGYSGETYLVGPDLLMRSSSRFQDNSILHTRVETKGVLQAMEGTVGTSIIDDYRGIRVLSSFSPVALNDLQWAILAEIDVTEALVPLNAIRNNIFLISSFIVLLLFFSALFMSARITSPIVRLKEAAIKIGQGDFKTTINPISNNEIGDLTHSFNQMARRIHNMTEELKQERFKRLSSAIDGQEQERQRLSRELHDGLGQQIIALNLKLENIKTGDACETARLIKEVKASVNETIDDVRRMSNDLMPAALYEFGIITALRNLVDDIAENTPVSGRFSYKGKPEILDKTTKIYLYRIAQEAVSNAVKHAAAATISIRLLCNENDLTLTVEDDGKGFDLQAGGFQKGNGLYNMRERALLMDGLFDLQTLPGAGTKIIVNIPCKNTNPDD